MAAAKQFKINFTTDALIGSPKGPLVKTNAKFLVRTSRVAKVRSAIRGQVANPAPVLTIAGEVLPSVLVRALANYVPTTFRPKTKDELLAMLVNVE